MITGQSNFYFTHYTQAERAAPVDTPSQNNSTLSQDIQSIKMEGVNQTLQIMPEERGHAWMVWDENDLQFTADCSGYTLHC